MVITIPREEFLELKENAARYVWLRSQPNDTIAPRVDICLWTNSGDDCVNDGVGLRGEEADRVIDEMRNA